MRSLSLALALLQATGTADAGCSPTAAPVCYADANDNRLLGPKTATSPMMKMTIAVCAQMCTDAKKKMAGVEYGKQCYCGDKPNYTPVASTACKMACEGNSTEKCGGDSAISVYSFDCSGAPVPIPPHGGGNHPSPPGPPMPKHNTPFVYYGCADAASKAMPHCDATKTDAARVDAILAKLSLADKIALGSPTKAPFCACHTTPIKSADLPDYSAR
jgi:hypothetical protein